jgi:hypothetical protein
LSDDSQGLSTDYTNEDDQGGFFDSADRTLTEDAMGLLDLEDYRFVLQVLSEQEGSFRSLQLIDRIIARFILAPVTYALSYHPTISGDIVVTLSNSTAYRALLMKILLNMFFLTAPTVHVLVEGQAA